MQNWGSGSVIIDTWYIRHDRTFTGRQVYWPAIRELKPPERHVLASML